VEYVGGCQCGRIRYRAEGPRDRSSGLLLSDVSKSIGAPLSWLSYAFPLIKCIGRNRPPYLQVQILSRGGFCSDCGTPLSYRQVNGPNISLTINSRDDPESVRPEFRFSRAARGV